MDIFQIVALVLLVTVLVAIKRWLAPALVEATGVPGGLLFIAGCYWLAVWIERQNK
jgi:hypothetical protein